MSWLSHSSLLKKHNSIHDIVVKLLNHDLTIFQDRLPRIQRKPTLEDRGAPELQARYPYQCQAINGDEVNAVGWLRMHLHGKATFLPQVQNLVALMHFLFQRTRTGVKTRAANICSIGIGKISNNILVLKAKQLSTLDDIWQHCELPQ